MSSNFPNALDSLTNPTATDSLDSANVPHADQHANANDAIEAIESTLGTNPQGASATVKARLDALDTTVADKETPAGAQAKADDAKTSAISTASADATTKANAAQAAAQTFATNADTTVASNASSALSTHASASTNVHGIADTSALVVNTDTRLTDTRTPTNGTVTDAKIDPSGLAQSSINGVAIAAWAPSTSYAKGALVSYQGVAYRRISAGTSDTTFMTSMWQQVTPTPSTSGASNSLVATDSSGNITATTVNASVLTNGGGTVTAGAYVQVGTGSVNGKIQQPASGTPTLILPSVSGTLALADGSNLANNAITTAKIADSQITSAKIVDATIIDADINGAAAIVATKISGTAKTALNPSSDQLAQEFMTSTGMDIQSRLLTANTRQLGNNVMYISWFVATKTFTCSTITVSVTVVGAPSAPPVNNKVQVGLFQPSDAQGAYSASTPTSAKCLAIAIKNGTATMGGFNAVTSESFTLGITKTVGSADSGTATPISITAGQVYGVGCVASATTGFSTAPSLAAYATGAAASGLAPYTVGQVSLTLLTDVQKDQIFTVTTGASATQWARLS